MSKREIEMEIDVGEAAETAGMSTHKEDDYRRPESGYENSLHL